MKMYALVAVAALFLTTTAAAQHVNVGLKAGANFYNVQNKPGAEYDGKTGFHAGLLGHIHLAPQLALQPEIVYSSQGAKYTVNNVETKYDLDYINVPILFQYMFDNGFRLQAGPQVGFLLSSEGKANGATVNYKDQTNGIDFSIGAGAGYIHPPTGFGVDLRYNHGLSNINEDDAMKSYNRGFQLGVFYLFNHKN